MQRREFARQFALAAAGCAAPVASGLAAALTGTDSERRSGVVPVAPDYPPGDVRRYGADPTGRRDSTAAFNAATFHDVDYSLEDVRAEIVVPAGRFRIDGTVYLRKGQTLRGAAGASYIVCNNAGTGPTFRVGWGLIDGHPRIDPGGQPPCIESLFLLGGPLAGCIECEQVAGALFRHLFFSAAACCLAIRDSGDLNIEDVIFDQGQQAITIQGSGNCQFSLLKFYLMNYDVSIGSATRDCQWSNCHSEYNRYSSILLNEGAREIRNLQFANWQHVYNPGDPTHYRTFSGCVHNRADGATLDFDSCSFSNMPGPAYVHGVGAGSRVIFNNCHFDGLRTFGGYAQSTAAAAVDTANESVVLQDCSFRNLPAEAVILRGGSPGSLDVRGGAYEGNGGDTFIHVSSTAPQSRLSISGLQGDGQQTLVNAQATVPVRIANCSNWFGKVLQAQGRRYVRIPYQAGSAWRILLHAGTAAGETHVFQLTLSVESAAAGENAILELRQHSDEPGTAEDLRAAFEAGDREEAQRTREPAGRLAVSWPQRFTQASVSIDML